MKTAIIIPCYNEEKRLNSKEYIDFSREYSNIHFIFVNDGSSDNTLWVLNNLAKEASNCHVVDLEENRGKAFAVYSGFDVAFRYQYDYIGFWDADLATPLDMIPKFCDLLDSGDHTAIFGCRLQRLGSNIKRKPMRHYMGRFFATLISRILALPIYDSQCGAKIFINNDALKKAFSKQFLTKWMFDVELIARLLKINESDREVYIKTVYEYPLEIWNDIDGSKVTTKDGLKAFYDNKLESSPPPGFDNFYTYSVLSWEKIH